MGLSNAERISRLEERLGVTVHFVYPAQRFLAVNVRAFMELTRS